MTVIEDRGEFFSGWRGAIREENFTVCEDNMNFLLTSLDNHSDSWVALVDKYNDGLEDLIDELKRIKDEYDQDKRLSKGYQASALQNERRRSFWVSMYDVFYQEFRRKSLVSVTK